MVHIPNDVTPSTPQSTLEDAECHCILHTDNQPPKKPRLHVLPFTDATWNAVQKSTSNRKQKKRFLSSKFYGVICYKFFTAVSRKRKKSLPTNTYGQHRSHHLVVPQLLVYSLDSVCFVTKFEKGKRRAVKKNLGHVKPKKLKDASGKLPGY